MRLNSFDTVIFDCDGVLLNSNKVKTQAFYDTAVIYGEKEATELVNYHIKNGGISRFKKFQWFFDKIVSTSDLYDINYMLNKYAAQVSNGLMYCEVDVALAPLFNRSYSPNWLVVSGGAQDELRKIFELRDLTKFFNSGVYGSPQDKYQIIDEQISLNNIRGNTVFIGDSKYDFEVAKFYGFQFIFVSHWTEFSNYKEFFSDENLIIVNDLSELF